MKPYFDDGTVSLYLGNCFEVLPELGITADAVITDCPYGETSLQWDRWQIGWPTLAATAASSMWCFGSMRMLLEHGHEFTAAGWKFSQDIVWEKHNGSGFHADRFKRVHESATHWYRGDWNNICHDTPRIAASPNSHTGGAAQGGQPVHTGTRGKSTWTDDGTRLMRSVQYIRSMHGRAIHNTEKPTGILDPLVRYACPPDGLVLDLFAGSGSTLDSARQAGRRAIGIEGNERHIEAAAKRLPQSVIDFEATS